MTKFGKQKLKLLGIAIDNELNLMNTLHNVCLKAYRKLSVQWKQEYYLKDVLNLSSDIASLRGCFIAETQIMK